MTELQQPAQPEQTLPAPATPNRSNRSNQTNRSGRHKRAMREWLIGGGEMGQLMRAKDWSQTPLGPIEGWPLSLRTMVGTMLASPHPIAVLWGQDLIFLYNDAYRPIASAKHPWILGGHAHVAWAEAWAILGPAFAEIMTTGAAVTLDDAPFTLERNGYPEEAHMSFAFGPIRDESGGIAGLFIPVTESTRRVLNERRIATLSALDAGHAATTVARVCDRALAALATNPADIPFALLYLLDESGTIAHLTGSVGLEALAGDSAAQCVVYPASVELTPQPPHTQGEGEAEGMGAAPAWPFAQAVQSQAAVEVDDLAARCGAVALPGGPWQEPARTAMVLPLTSSTSERPVGVLVLGASPRMPFDDAYREFFTRAAGQIVAAIANAQAHEREQQGIAALAADHAHASEEWYRRLFTTMDQGFCVVEKVETAEDQPSDYRYLTANPAFERHTGLRNVVGKTIRELLPDAAQSTMDIYDDVARTGRHRLFEVYIAALDLWMEARAYPTETPGQIAVLFSNITERKRAEAALRQFAALADSSDEFFGLCDMRFTPFYVNSAGLRLVGLDSLDDARQTSVLDFFYPRDQALIRDDFLPRILRDGRGEIEIQFRHFKTGEAIWVIYSVVLLRDEHGNPIGYGTITRDITAHRRIEEALRASAAQFRAVADLVPDLLWSNDPTGYTAWYNRRWLDYTGQTLTEALGYGWLDAIHPDDRATSFTHFQTAIDSGQPLIQEHRIRRADGRYRWFLVHAAPVRDESGYIAQWFGAATDIHEQRAEREELTAQVAAATAELRALSRQLLTVQEEERRHLARELHDEIGQALTGLHLRLASLRRGGARIKGARHIWVTDAQDMALSEAEAIVRELTTQVSALSVDLRPAALDTLGLLPALLTHIDRYMARTSITVDLRRHGLDRRFPSEVEITAFRVVQEALTNVARHAGTSHATVQLLADEHMLTVTIRDAGRGFDPGAEPGGGGLGGMRERVELLGGTLEIESAPGAGTQVSADLPLGQFPEATRAGEGADETPEEHIVD